MLFFEDFHSKEVFRRSFNATFLALIPKKGGVDDIKDFKSISLVGISISLLLRCWKIG